MLIWNLSFPNQIDDYILISKAERDALRISRRESRGSGRHGSTICILTPFSKIPFLPLVYWDLQEKPRRNKESYLLLAVEQVTHWQNSSIALAGTQKAHILKGGLKIKKGHWPTGEESTCSFLLKQSSRTNALPTRVVKRDAGLRL